MVWSAPDHVSILSHGFGERPVRFSSRWAPQQHVLPGALWHDQRAHCKHRTSRSGLVPGRRLYKPLQLDGLWTWLASKVQAAPASVLGVSDVCLYMGHVSRVIWMMMMLSTFCKQVKPASWKRASGLVWLSNVACTYAVDISIYVLWAIVCVCLVPNLWLFDSEAF